MSIQVLVREGKLSVSRHRMEKYSVQPYLLDVIMI